MRAEDAAIEALLGWIADGGGNCSGVAIRRGGAAGRSAFARAPIEGGGVVVEIPRTHLVTRELATASAIGAAVAASGVALGGSQAYLAAFLLQEKRDERSFFRPYLAALPRSYRDVPVLFDDEELALLAGSFTLPWIRRRQAALAAEYDGLRRLARGFARFALDEYLWARLAVATRVFSLVIDGQKTEVLVPVADMLNHRSPRETRWSYEDGARAFVMTALRGFLPGDAIHDSYGRKGNGRLFANYGFLLDDRDDEAAISVAVAQSDPLRAEKLAAMAALGAAVDGERSATLYLQAGDGGPSVAATLGCLRIACAGAGELPEGGVLRAAATPLGVESEQAALCALAAACEAALAGFPTTRAEDDALLGDPRLTGNRRRCVLVRRGEKRVLQSHLDFARAAAPLLRRQPGDRARAVAERGTEGLRAYLEDVAPRLDGQARRDSAPPTRR